MNTLIKIACQSIIELYTVLYEQQAVSMTNITLIGAIALLISLLQVILNVWLKILNNEY